MEWWSFLHIKKGLSGNFKPFYFYGDDEARTRVASCGKDVLFNIKGTSNNYQSVTPSKSEVK